MVLQRDISKGNQARLRENKLMFEIGQTVEVSGKGHGKVTAVNMRGSKVKSYDVALENGTSGRFVFVSAPVEFAAPDRTAFNKPLNRDYYGDQARMFARSGIG